MTSAACRPPKRRSSSSKASGASRRSGSAVALLAAVRRAGARRRPGPRRALVGLPRGHAVLRPERLRAVLAGRAPRRRVRAGQPVRAPATGARRAGLLRRARALPACLPVADGGRDGRSCHDRGQTTGSTAKRRPGRVIHATHEQVDPAPRQSRPKRTPEHRTARSPSSMRSSRAILVARRRTAKAYAGSARGRRRTTAARHRGSPDATVRRCPARRSRDRPHDDRVAPAAHRHRVDAHEVAAAALSTSPRHPEPTRRRRSAERAGTQARKRGGRSRDRPDGSEGASA